MNPINVLIVDNHPVVRQGVRMLIDTAPTIQVVGEAEDGRSAVRQVKSLRPDVVLMDLVMPRQDGFEAIAEIKRDYPDVKIVVLTTFDGENMINAAMKSGADGYLLKNADGEALLEAVHSAYRGDMPLNPRIARHLVRGGSRKDHLSAIDRLTGREREVLQLVVRGLSNKKVAQTLSLSHGTVKIHVSNILDKLHVSSRTEAAVLATRLGLVSLDQNGDGSNRPFGVGFLTEK